MKSLTRLSWRLTVVLGVAFLAISPLLAQETRYIYDAAGRLVGVVDPQGRVTTYEYDAVGNILAVRRIEASDPLAITVVSPAAAVAGSSVDIFGVGFSATPSNNSVSFNGVPAVVAAATAVRLSVLVPVNASTGPISVTVTGRTAVSPNSFTIPTIELAPASAVVGLGRSVQFTAAVTEVASQQVTWSVNGVVGGSAVTGRISASGLYTAPPDLPLPATLSIQARSAAFPQLVASASVSLVPPSTSVIATPVDIRLVRVGTGDPGGLPVNVTAAAPPAVVVVRPGTGDPGGLPVNTTVAAPPQVVVVRSGTGESGGLPTNLVVAVPSGVAIVRPGTGDPAGLGTNVTVATPASVTVVRPAAGDPGGIPASVTVGTPSGVIVIRPGIGEAGTVPANVTVARPSDVRVRGPQ